MSYISDLNDKEWDLIKGFFKRKDPRGRKETHSKRTIVNAILYVIKGGIQWNMLPNDFPPHKTVYDYFSQWNKSGLWDEMLTFLTQKVREKKGRSPDPTYGIVDSQSSKTVYTKEEQGFDGNKKIKGRKRHIVVDIEGNLLSIKVHAANIHDTKGGCEVLARAKDKYPSIEAFSGDQGYRKTAVEYCAKELNVRLHISEKIKDTFSVTPKRWVVERTFAWLGNYRRLNKDLEIMPATAENVVRIAMIKITLAKVT